MEHEVFKKFMSLLDKTEDWEYEIDRRYTEDYWENFKYIIWENFILRKDDKQIYIRRYLEKGFPKDDCRNFIKYTTKYSQIIEYELESPIWYDLWEKLDEIKTHNSVSGKVNKVLNDNPFPTDLLINVDHWKVSYISKDVLLLETVSDHINSESTINLSVSYLPSTGDFLIILRNRETQTEFTVKKLEVLYDTLFKLFEKAKKKYAYYNQIEKLRNIECFIEDF